MLKCGLLKNTSTSDKLPKIAKNTTVFAAMIVVLSASHYQLTKNTITCYPNNQEIKYKHSDPKSDQILQYILGEKELPESMRSDFLKQIIKFMAKNNNVEISNSINNCNDIPSIKAFIKKNDLEIFFIDPSHPTFEKGFNEVLNMLPSKLPTKSSKYQKGIYTVLEKAGSPKIEFAKGGKSRSPLSLEVMHYSSFENKVFISPLEIDKSLTMELPHSEQFRTNPAIASMKFAIDGFSVLYANLAINLQNILQRRELEAIEETHSNTMYDDPNRLEGEAHIKLMPWYEKQLKESPQPKR